MATWQLLVGWHRKTASGTRSYESPNQVVSSLVTTALLLMSRGSLRLFGCWGFRLNAGALAGPVQLLGYARRAKASRAADRVRQHLHFLHLRRRDALKYELGNARAALDWARGTACEARCDAGMREAATHGGSQRR